MRWMQELSDTTQRARLGGPFYLLGWALAWLAATGSTPRAAWIVGALFLVGIVVRLRLAARLPRRRESVRRRIDLTWLTVAGTTLLWGVACAWMIAIERAQDVRLVMLVCTLAFATAIAHSFCMRLGRALAALATLYVPQLATMLLFGIDPIAVWVMAIYLVYLLLVLRRSHREYQQRLDQEDELRRQRDLYERRSHLDGLTGVPNRRRFADQYERLVQEAAAGGPGFALLILDLDHFKAINDQLGHAAGDECLRSFASRLQQAFCGADELVARLGGEEFGVLVEGLDEDTAVARCEAFREEVAAAPLLPSAPGRAVTVSIGVGAFEPGATHSAESFFRAVDQALYRAKAEGRNAVRCSASGR